MLTIVYASRATRPMASEDLTLLLEVAHARNGACAVTGMLLYAQLSFLQQIEGEPEAVEEIFASILDDERHTGIRLLSRREVQGRRFPDWSMGFAHPERASLQAQVPGYRFAEDAPLVSAELVHDGEMAESLLSAYADALSI